jgi:acetyltransferase-like isoleucine patch superfamily enzyme
VKLHVTFKGNNNQITIADNCILMGQSSIYIEGDNNKVVISRNSIFNTGLSLVLAEGTEIQIGEQCLFAKDVLIRTSDQHFIYDSDGNRCNEAKNVRIGNHVWIGADVTIMKGVSIDDDVVIGMKSMVTKSVDKNSVAAGSPAKVIRKGVIWKKNE